jgi:hypothetical protein
MSQTTVASAGQSIGVAGQVADSGPHDIVSKFSEEASAEMAFGLGVVQGTGANGVLLPSGSGDKFAGVNVFGFNHMPGTNGDLGTTGLKPKAGLQLMRKGRILVKLDKSVTVVSPGVDRPYLRYTADGTTNPEVGAFGVASDSGKNLDITKNGVFVSGMLTLADGTGHAAILEFDAAIKP